jgi:hypothetical protein
LRRRRRRSNPYGLRRSGFRFVLRRRLWFRSHGDNGLRFGLRLRPDVGSGRRLVNVFEFMVDVLNRRIGCGNRLRLRLDFLNLFELYVDFRFRWNLRRRRDFDRYFGDGFGNCGRLGLGDLDDIERNPDRV